MSVLKQLLQAVYDRTIRDHLPKRFGVFNGIPVRKVPLLDSTDEWPEHEEPNVQAHLQHTTSGDSVVILGGGYGVSAAYAARSVGENGEVIVVEPAVESVNICRETFERQHVDDIVDIERASVGEINNPYGDVAGAAEIAPADLPVCDVLEVDIEGAELYVLDNMTIRPRHIYLETHGTANISKEEGIERLEAMGYEILNVEPEFEEKEIYVIIARKRT